VLFSALEFACLHMRAAQRLAQQAPAIAPVSATLASTPASNLSITFSFDPFKRPTMVLST